MIFEPQSAQRSQRFSFLTVIPNVCEGSHAYRGDLSTRSRSVEMTITEGRVG